MVAVDVTGGHQVDSDAVEVIPSAEVGAFEDIEDGEPFCLAGLDSWGLVVTTCSL